MMRLTYDAVSWLPDGKQLLASGIEAGHGARDYLIDSASGDAKPVTPEGVAGSSHIAGRQERSGIGSRWKMGSLVAGAEFASADSQDSDASLPR